MLRQLQAKPNMKLEQSHDFFKSTKISTCSYVKKVGDTFVAMPYYTRAKPKYPLNKSMYTTSTSGDTYVQPRRQHSSMHKKPLSPYNPNAQRSRLQDLCTHVSRGQIEIGDRSHSVHKHYVTQYSNQIGNFGVSTPCTHPKIQAERARWSHHMKDY